MVVDGMDRTSWRSSTCGSYPCARRAHSNPAFDWTAKVKCSVMQPMLCTTDNASKILIRALPSYVTTVGAMQAPPAEKVHK